MDVSPKALRHVFDQHVNPDVVIRPRRNYGTGKSDPEHQHPQHRIDPDHTFREEIPRKHLKYGQQDHTGEDNDEKTVLHPVDDANYCSARLLHVLNSN